MTVVYFWRISKVALPIAILNMASNKLLLKKIPGISFIKLLGTGKGETFTPKDADQFRWGILATINEDKLDQLEKSLVLKLWRKISSNEYRAILKPISSHGYWSGKQPFEVEKFEWSGKIVAITRARIVWRKNFQFWRAVPPVTLSLHQSQGLLAAIGIGEAPIGLQGTFSIWESGAALREFAYKGNAHVQAIKATESNKWYSEELFARFAVIAEQGVLL
ncbi:spheroidene monooxygenase [Candidatus Nanopelagicus hibericus]|uniref:Spheroidene monooxygenase n=1 Tax=Candidatus Nanopelagicus hibericus TaxID=1884915 RepID=A0A249KAY0_9ACTN|nr:spheroidene monooxygenase [Candidatus Nanopelagicus hibericus]